MTTINKLADKASHIAAVYDASITAAREHGIDQLARYREIGSYIVELNSTFSAGRGKSKGNKKLQAFVIDNNLEGLWKDKQGKADAVYVAENWKSLKKFMTKQSMESGSATYVRKMHQSSLRKAGKPKTKAENKKTIVSPSNTLPGTKRSTPASEQYAFEQASSFLELCLFSDSQLVSVFNRIGKALDISEKSKALAASKKLGNARGKTKANKLKVTAKLNSKISAQARDKRLADKANNVAPELTHAAAS